MWMLHIGRARHPGPGKRFFYPWSAVGGICQRRWVVDLWEFGVGFLCSVLGCC